MRAISPAFLLVLLPAFAACGAEAHSNPKVYCTLDQEFSEPLLKQFSKELGFAIDQRYDTEGTKTVGLVSAINEEKSNPRCSVFWNNELAHTVRLAQLGLLEPYDSPAAAAIPAAFQDPQHHWTGFAARARVLIVNTDKLPDPQQWPTGYRDLIDPKWRGRCGVAKPINGTTLTHFTALRQVLGEAKFGEFLDGLAQNDVRMLGGNGACAVQVREGQLDWAFTDTDDYHVAKSKGFHVACVFPDQQEGGIGTMLIPNSVALVKGGPNPEASKRVIDKILAVETEALLAAAESAQIPLRSGIKGPDDPSILAVGAFRALPWDVAATARDLALCGQEFGKRFGQ